MGMGLVRAALAAGVLVLAAGCGGPATGSGSPAGGGPDPTTDGQGGAIPVVDPGAIKYACGRFAFGQDILNVPRNDETAATPFAAALRKHVARQEMDINWLPDTGWTLTGQDAEGAEFVTSTGSELFSVTVGRVIGPAQEPFAVDGWAVDGWGGCTPQRVLAAGLANAEWTLAPGQAIGPTTTQFDALVTERACASGQTSEGRIVGPDMAAIGDAVLVTFAVREPDGRFTQTCQSNPATRVTVTLPEPLLGRALLDGSTLPPRAPVAEP
jgi:hypothetical protein